MANVLGSDIALKFLVNDPTKIISPLELPKISGKRHLPEEIPVAYAASPIHTKNRMSNVIVVLKNDSCRGERHL